MFLVSSIFDVLKTRDPRVTLGMPRLLIASRVQLGYASWILKFAEVRGPLRRFRAAGLTVNFTTYRNSL